MTDAVVMRRPPCRAYQQPVRVSYTDAVTRCRGKSRASEATNPAGNTGAQALRAAARVVNFEPAATALAEAPDPAAERMAVPVTAAAACPDADAGATAPEPLANAG